MPFSHFMGCIFTDKRMIIGSERRKLMIDQEKIGGFLRDLRKEKGQTQEELAEKFGVSSKSVSRWETGVSQS